MGTVYLINLIAAVNDLQSRLPIDIHIVGIAGDIWTHVIILRIVPSPLNFYHKANLTTTVLGLFLELPFHHIFGEEQSDWLPGQLFHKLMTNRGKSIPLCWIEIFYPRTNDSISHGVAAQQYE